MTKAIMPFDQVIAGILQSIKDGTQATDAIVILVNRETGEFKCAGLPYDPPRNADVLERALSRFKRTAAREGRIRSSLKLPH